MNLLKSFDSCIDRALMIWMFCA
ncbi:unnamed protein product [Nezara viridula]|uniref:Uncharacterized protein n=1 Tax=Nezara viridula TaxID=85310 RepID=A0A9P0H5E1_NEZVI|nr:unnamed protein product [Nezara viridula]